MNTCDNEYFCLSCTYTKHASKFMKWIADKSKSRRCDSCQDDPVVKERLDRCKDERKEKPNATSDTPQFVGLSKKDESKKKCMVRDSIADIKAQREIDEFVGL